MESEKESKSEKGEAEGTAQRHFTAERHSEAHGRTAEGKNRADALTAERVRYLWQKRGKHSLFHPFEGGSWMLRLPLHLFRKRTAKVENLPVSESGSVWSKLKLTASGILLWFLNDERRRKMVSFGREKGRFSREKEEENGKSEFGKKKVYAGREWEEGFQKIIFLPKVGFWVKFPRSYKIPLQTAVRVQPNAGPDSSKTRQHQAGEGRISIVLHEKDIGHSFIINNLPSCLRPGYFSEDLYAEPPKTMEELQARVAKFIRVKDIR
ncbi:hypothetical protein LR48_Vigan10g260400 [Vigna angularis]|uniref:Uncharacterized protein n=1 Tax=Phaseolus angularis TaxID=3914 RepID=A0A0L9VP81_PHAAN|nr:hypothetical protein LR48_Vigan10g260400 [Vigna angularis]